MKNMKFVLVGIVLMALVGLFQYQALGVSAGSLSMIPKQKDPSTDKQ